MKIGFDFRSVRSGVWWGTALGLGWFGGEWLAEWWRYR